LRAKLSYEPIGFDLLNKKFSFTELETLYSTVLDRPIDRRNFRKKMLSFGLLEELTEKISEGPGRPATLYRFNEKKYSELKKGGFMFDLS
jgi:8-oxo-dGTP diphosphatase